MEGLRAGRRQQWRQGRRRWADVEGGRRRKGAGAKRRLDRVVGAEGVSGRTGGFGRHGGERRGMWAWGGGGGAASASVLWIGGGGSEQAGVRVGRGVEGGRGGGACHLWWGEERFDAQPWEASGGPARASGLATTGESGGMYVQRRGVACIPWGMRLVLFLIFLRTLILLAAHDSLPLLWLLSGSGCLCHGLPLSSYPPHPH